MIRRAGIDAAGFTQRPDPRGGPGHRDLTPG
jgi:hypothetical protein